MIKINLLKTPKPKFPEIGPWRLVNGYIAYYTKEKFTVYEHRLVMEKRLGRELLDNEVIHHKNHVRYDNSDENLELLSDIEHMKHHALEKYGIPVYPECATCGKVLTRKNGVHCSAECDGIRSRHPNRPDDNKLKFMLQTMRNCEIVKAINVTETAIRKWRKKYNIPYRRVP